MRGFVGFTKRNLLIYFKDIHAVIFSLLTSIIVFVLYLLFLKGGFVSAIENVATGLEDFVSEQDIEMLVSAILLVGIIGSALITVPYSCLTTVIKDRETKIDFDISATPMKRWQIILAYLLSAIISSFLVTAIILTAGLMIISQMGDINLAAVELVELYGVVLLGCVSSTALFMCMALFFNSSSASSAFFGMLSAASGFVIGAYIPLSQFSERVQTICNIFPATQITVLIRNKMMNGILGSINEGIGGVDEGAFVTGIKEAFNFDAKIMGNVLEVPKMYAYITAVFAMSVIVMVVTFQRTYKKR